MQDTSIKEELAILRTNLNRSIVIAQHGPEITPVCMGLGNGASETSGGLDPCNIRRAASLQPFFFHEISSGSRKGSFRGFGESPQQYSGSLRQMVEAWEIQIPI